MEYINKKGQTYYLHGMIATLRGNGRQQQIYYFSKVVDLSKSLDELPKGYKVVENSRTGLPVLKKS